MIRFLIFLTKRVGNMAVLLSLCQSALGRTQTRLFTIAQFKGWKPATDDESDRLVHRQFKLFLWRTEKALAKKQKRGATIFENQPPTNQTGNNL